MASTFPGAIDSFTDPLSNSPLNSPSHSTLHSDINDAVEKVEQYMGLVKVIPTSVSSAGGTAATLNSTTGTVTVGNGNTSVTVTCFSSLYDNYRVLMSSTAASVETFLKLQFGSATTSYYGTQFYDLYTGGDTGYARTNNGDALRVCPLALASGRSLVSIDIFQPFLTTYTMFAGSTYGNGYTGYSGGEQFSVTSHTSFKLSLGSGSFTGGTIRVYGYRN